MLFLLIRQDSTCSGLSISRLMAAFSGASGSAPGGIRRLLIRITRMSFPLQTH
jgi:hypothetical protein